jgi:aspartyl-tRNA(Asn)/glutamyl-tRNA(Gln) amidotransferase subunit C
MAIDRTDVENIATLARIGLTEQEFELFREQLSHILEQIEILRLLDTTGVSPTGHAAALQSVMRDDHPDDSLKPEEVLLNAPRREGEYFRVNLILDE